MDHYYCDTCSYSYDPQVGDPDTGIDPGTPASHLPKKWRCPLAHDYQVRGATHSGHAWLAALRSLEEQCNEGYERQVWHNPLKRWNGDDEFTENGDEHQAIVSVINVLRSKKQFSPHLKITRAEESGNIKIAFARSSSLFRSTIALKHSLEDGLRGVSFDLFKQHVYFSCILLGDVKSALAATRAYDDPAPLMEITRPRSARIVPELDGPARNIFFFGHDGFLLSFNEADQLLHRPKRSMFDGEFSAIELSWMPHMKVYIIR